MRGGEGREESGGGTKKVKGGSQTPSPTPVPPFQRGQINDVGHPPHWTPSHAWGEGGETWPGQRTARGPAGGTLPPPSRSTHSRRRHKRIIRKGLKNQRCAQMKSKKTLRMKIAPPLLPYCVAWIPKAPPGLQTSGGRAVAKPKVAGVYSTLGEYKGGQLTRGDRIPVRSPWARAWAEGVEIAALSLRLVPVPRQLTSVRSAARPCAPISDPPLKTLPLIEITLLPINVPLEFLVLAPEFLQRGQNKEKENKVISRITYPHAGFRFSDLKNRTVKVQIWGFLNTNYIRLL